MNISAKSWRFFLVIALVIAAVCFLGYGTFLNLEGKKGVPAIAGAPAADENSGEKAAPADDKAPCIDVDALAKAVTDAVVKALEPTLTSIRGTVEKIDKNVGEDKDGKRSLHQKADDIEAKLDKHDKKLDEHRTVMENGKGKLSPGDAPAAGPKTEKPKDKGKTDGSTTKADEKNCGMAKTYSKSLGEDYSKDPVHCEAVSNMISLGKVCYAIDQRAWLLRNDRICQKSKKKGLKGFRAKFERSFRGATTDRMQRGWGEDLANGWEENEGGDPWESFGGAATLFAAGNWVWDKGGVKEKFKRGKGYDTPGLGNPSSGLIGPGEPGGTSYADTVGNSGVPINTHISQMTPVEGIGGPGIYGTNHPIASGASYSADNTLPSNLTSNGHSSGMTKLSGTVSVSGFEAAGRKGSEMFQ